MKLEFFEATVMTEREEDTAMGRKRRSASDVRWYRHRNAMAAKTREASSRVSALERQRAEIADELDGVTARLDNLAPYLHGWALELVVGLGILAFALEWYPSRLVAYAFDVTETSSLYLMTAAIAFAGWLSGFVIGDIAWRHRKPQHHARLYTFALVLAIAAAVAYLWMGYENRLTYASLVIDGSKIQMLVPWKLALSLTGLSAIGIALACLTGIMRESKEAAILRRRANHLDGALETCNAQLTASKSEQTESEASYRETYEPKAPAQLQVIAPAGAPAPAAAPAQALPPTVTAFSEDVQLANKVSENHAGATAGKGLTS